MSVWLLPRAFHIRCVTYIPLSDDKQRIAQKVHPHVQMVTIYADVYVTQITTAVCGNVATVTSYQRIQYDVTVATVPHTVVVFRMQSFN